MIDKKIVAVTGDNGLADIEFVADDSLRNLIWVSYMTKRGSRFSDMEFGSRLHLLQLRGGRINSALLTDAQMYAVEALQWLIKTGRILSVSVSVSQNSDIHTRIDIETIVVNATNEQITYTTWYDVI